MARKVQFVETVLRDANQSLIATRLPYAKFEPMLETIDKAGFYAAECWGGATFTIYNIIIPIYKCKDDFSSFSGFIHLFSES